MKRLMQILSVEDNAGDARLIAELFKSSGLAANLVFVKDGAQALDYVFKRGTYTEAIRPDLILLDLNLPKVSGHQVLAKIKGDTDLKNIPILILTTSNSQRDVCSSYDLYANSFITKPVDLDQFDQVAKNIASFWFNTATLPSC
jgi:chemotaxis family two-component system response regulator Rcp1